MSGSEQNRIKNLKKAVTEYKLTIFPLHIANFVSALVH